MQLNYTKCMFSVDMLQSTVIYASLSEIIDAYKRFYKKCNKKCDKCILSLKSGYGNLTICDVLRNCNLE